LVWHSSLWRESAKLAADFMGHDEIAGLSRLSEFSRLNLGPKTMATETDLWSKNEAAAA
jgi:hypothetical protein